MKNRVCKLSFHYYGNPLLDTFSNGVNNGIFSNPLVFVTPPMTSTELLDAVKNYNNALSVYEANGKNYKTAFLNAKKKLIDTLNTLVEYVNKIANGDPSIITMAGFFPTASSSQAAPKLEKILIVTVKATNVSGQVIIETPAITGKGVSGYGLILVSNEWLDLNSFFNGILNVTPSEGQRIICDFTKSKRKVINGLDSNIVYYGYMFATNSTGVSPLSNPARVKCI